MPEVARLLRTHSFLFALVLAVVLLAANLIALPSFGSPGNWAADLGVFAPVALVAMATTPSVLSGGGGLDISIGPLANFVSIFYVLELLPHGLGSPIPAILILLAVGAGIGAVNGVLVAVLRFQPVIATLCSYFVLGGANLALAPTPQTASTNWTSHVAGSIGPVPGGLITIGVGFVAWGLLRRTAYARTLFAVGGNDAAALSAGVNVTSVRVIAYALGGVLAAIAGIALVGLVETADPSYGTQYTLIGLASVALGGTPIGGGRGGILGSLCGAASIYLLENLLLSTHVSANWLQVVYGMLLLVGVMISAQVTTRRMGRAV